MAVVARGAGGTLGIGIESTWGTPVSRTNWMEVNTLGLARKIENKAEPDLGRLGKAATTRRFPYQGSDNAEGPISWVAAYNDSTVMLLTQILGAVATTGPDGTQYTHEITLASPPPIGVTLEQINGVAPTGSALADLMSEVFEGCKFTGARISLQAGGQLTVEADVIAQTSGGLVDAGSPSYSAGRERINHNHLSTLTLGGQTRKLNSFTITIERDLQRNQELGSLLTSEPNEGPEGLKITVELRAKWQTDVYDTALLAGTQSDLVIGFTGSGDNALTITAHNLQLDSVDRQVSDRGPIELVVKGTAYADGTDQGLTMAFKNASSSATAN